MKCKSELNTKEIKLCLTENTKIGKPEFKGSLMSAFTMFGQTKKLFYGEIEGNKFRITKNSALFTIPYIVKGKISNTNSTSSKISYTIEKIPFGYWWLRIFPLIALVSVNSVCFFHRNSFNPFLFIPINIYLLLMFTPIIIINRKKKKFIKLIYQTLRLKEI